MKLNELFEEWSKGLTEGSPSTDHALSVSFLNDKGVVKTLRVLPTRVGANLFGARLTEGGYCVGDFELIVREHAPPEHLGSYTLTVDPNDEVSRRHYEDNESPINGDKDFENFVTGFHLAIKNWAESQQSNKEL